MGKRDRPAKNPGGMQCEACDEIFVGEPWHRFCALCQKRRDDAHCRDVFAENVKYGGMP